MQPPNAVRGRNEGPSMPHPMVEEARVQLAEAQSQLDAALRAWDANVSELWRTSLALTRAQKRVTHAHELLRKALDAVRPPQGTDPESGG